MENNKNTNVTNETFEQQASEYTIEEKVVAKIVKKVVDKVDGILGLQGNILSSITQSISNNQDSTSGIDVDIEDKTAVVKTNLIVEYGKKAPHVFNQLDRLIKEEVLNLTGIKVQAVKANIVDMMTREEYNKKQSSEENNQEQ